MKWILQLGVQYFFTYKCQVLVLYRTAEGMKKLFMFEQIKVTSSYLELYFEKIEMILEPQSSYYQFWWPRYTRSP